MFYKNSSSTVKVNSHWLKRKSKLLIYDWNTASKVSKYGVFSGPCFPVFGLNTGKYGPENTPYLDTFHLAEDFWNF